MSNEKPTTQRSVPQTEWRKQIEERLKFVEQTARRLRAYAAAARRS